MKKLSIITVLLFTVLASYAQQTPPQNALRNPTMRYVANMNTSFVILDAGMAAVISGYFIRKDSQKQTGKDWGLLLMVTGGNSIIVANMNAVSARIRYKRTVVYLGPTGGGVKYQFD